MAVVVGIGFRGRTGRKVSISEPLQCLGENGHWLGLTGGVEREVRDLRRNWEVGPKGVAEGLE